MSLLKISLRQKVLGWLALILKCCELKALSPSVASVINTSKHPVPCKQLNAVSAGEYGAAVMESVLPVWGTVYQNKTKTSEIC